MSGWVFIGTRLLLETSKPKSSLTVGVGRPLAGPDQPARERLLRVFTHLS